MAVCGLSTQKDLFNSALTLFEWAVGEVRQGRSVASIDEATQRYREIAMPALSNARRSTVEPMVAHPLLQRGGSNQKYEVA